MFDDDLGFPRHHLALEMLAFVAASCHGTTTKKGFMDKENMLETTIQTDLLASKSNVQSC